MFEVFIVVAQANAGGFAFITINVGAAKIVVITDDTAVHSNDDTVVIPIFFNNRSANYDAVLDGAGVTASYATGRISSFDSGIAEDHVLHGTFEADCAKETYIVRRSMDVCAADGVTLTVKGTVERRSLARAIISADA